MVANTFFNIMNILKHLVNLLFALIYAFVVTLVIYAAFLIDFLIVWIIAFYFVYGFFLHVVVLHTEYKNQWENKGTSWKSLIYLITRK